MRVPNVPDTHCWSKLPQNDTTLSSKYLYSKTKNKPNKTDPTVKYNVKHIETIESKSSGLPQESCSFVFLGAKLLSNRKTSFIGRKWSCHQSCKNYSFGKFSQTSIKRRQFSFRFARPPATLLIFLRTSIPPPIPCNPTDSTRSPFFCSNHLIDTEMSLCRIFAFSNECILVLYHS